MRILAAVAKTEPLWTHLPSATPRWTKRLLERCLKKDPRQRLHDIADARIELQEDRSLEPEAGDTRGPSRRLPWIGAMVAAVVLTAIGTYLVSARKGSDEPPFRPEIHLRQLTGRPDDQTLRSAALSPNGESLAFVTEAGLFLQLVETGEEQQIPLPEKLQVHEVDWLVPGSTLLFSAASGGESGLYKVSIFGGTPTKIADNAWRAAVSPDGQHIAYLESLPSKVMRLIDVDGGNARSLAELEGDDSFWEIAWSPDGRWLLAGRWGGATFPFDTVLEAINVASGEMRPVMSDPRFFQNWRAFLPFAWVADGRLIFARRELPPNEMSSNLWQVDIDVKTAQVHGSPTRLTQFTGVNLKDLSLTSDGRRLSFLQERNQNDVLLADLRQDGALATVRSVVTDDGEDRPLGFSPDDETLYFESTRSGAWSIYRIGLHQGRPELLAKMRKESPFSFEVSRDGRSLLFWDGSELKREPAEGGPEQSVLTAGDWPELSCSSDKDTCLVGDKSEDGRMYRLFSFDWESGRGEEVLHFDTDSPFTNWILSPDGSRVVVGSIRRPRPTSRSHRVLSATSRSTGSTPWVVRGSTFARKGSATSTRSRRPSSRALTPRSGSFPAPVMARTFSSRRSTWQSASRSGCRRSSSRSSQPSGRPAHSPRQLIVHS